MAGDLGQQYFFDPRFSGPLTDMENETNLGGNGLVNWAEQWVPSGLTALIVGTVPIWFVTLAWLGPDREAPTGLEVAGVLLGLGGVGVLMSGSLDAVGLHGATSRQVLIGAVALAVATVSWAVGSMYSRRARLARPTLLATAMTMLSGGGLLLAAGLLLGETRDLDLAGVSTRSLVALVYLIVFGSIVAFSSFTWLIQVVRPALAGTYAYVNPIVAVILGWAVADEVITREMAFGAVLIIGAVVLVERGRSRARKLRASAPPPMKAHAASSSEAASARTEPA